MALVWRGAVVGVVALLMLIISATIALPQPVARPGVEPQDAWTCPATHPIKGQLHSHRSARGVHLPRPGRRLLRQDEAGAVLRHG